MEAEEAHLENNCPPQKTLNLMDFVLQLSGIPTVAYFLTVFRPALLPYLPQVSPDVGLHPHVTTTSPCSS